MATAKVRDRWQQLFWGGIKLKGLNGLFELSSAECSSFLSIPKAFTTGPFCSPKTN